MSLESLRRDPTDSCKLYVYRTGPKAGSFAAVEEGGACTIESSVASRGFFDLKAATGGPDYFYPWLQRGVGWVKVPKNAANGTIVMTGGVNGCTLVVSESGAHYYFYHDGDSKFLKPAQIVGNVVAKVEPKDYDPLGMGNRMFSDKLSEMAKAGKQPRGDVSYGHFVVAVKKDGKFGFYATGCMSLNGLTKLPYGITPCIVTFGGD